MRQATFLINYLTDILVDQLSNSVNGLLCNVLSYVSRVFSNMWTFNADDVVIEIPIIFLLLYHLWIMVSLFILFLLHGNVFSVCNVNLVFLHGISSLNYFFDCESCGFLLTLFVESVVLPSVLDRLYIGL